MKLFDSNFSALQTDMSFRLRRQNIIASNLANINTPGYQARDIRFEDAVRDVYAAERERIETQRTEMRVTDGQHMISPEQGPDGKTDIATYLVQSPGIDENGVDLDREMARMTENTLMYSAAAMAMRKKMGILKYAATGGGS